MPVGSGSPGCPAPFSLPGWAPPPFANSPVAPPLPPGPAHCLQDLAGERRRVQQLEREVAALSRAAAGGSPWQGLVAVACHSVVAPIAPTVARRSCLTQSSPPPVHSQKAVQRVKAHPPSLLQGRDWMWLPSWQTLLPPILRSCSRTHWREDNRSPTARGRRMASATRTSMFDGTCCSNVILPITACNTYCEQAMCRFGQRILHMADLVEGLRAGQPAVGASTAGSAKLGSTQQAFSLWWTCDTKAALKFPFYRRWEPTAASWTSLKSPRRPWCTRCSGGWSASPSQRSG